MRVANVDGLVTLFYDGSDIYNEELPREWDGFRSPNGEDLQSNEDVPSDCKNYMTQRLSWEQILVIEGVAAILPPRAFHRIVALTSQK